MQPHLDLAVAAPHVIYLSTNNSDVLKYTVKLLGDFLFGATNPDHTSLGKDGVSSEESECFHCQFPRGRVSSPAGREEREPQTE